MKRAGIPARAIIETNASRDSASQIARATLGLRELLVRGALRPGQRIAEIPLSAKLGVSRTPLRLAFEKLEHEGLVKALPHSGFAALRIGGVRQDADTELLQVASDLVAFFVKIVGDLSQQDDPARLR